jgi:hypothetical protein
MNKKSLKFTLFILLMVSSIIFAGCYTSMSKEKKVIESFLKKYYTITDYNKYEETILTKESFKNDYMKENDYESIMTYSAFNQFSQRGDFLFFLQGANFKKTNFSVKDIKIEKYTTLEDKSVVYNYEAKVEVYFTETKQKKDESITGQLTLTKSNDNKWVISKINKMNEPLMKP